jgi:hypothetical protein
MLRSTTAFIDSLEKWLRAVHADDFDAARVHAQDLTLSGELLAIHPEFIRSFQEHCQGDDPKQALLHLCQFLVCTTDGRAKVLKQWTNDNRPMPV